MNGLTWMDELLSCGDARSRIPLGLQATLPLPGRHGADAAECWYYRIRRCDDGPWVLSPQLHAVWDVHTLTLRSLDTLTPAPLGAAADLLRPGFREAEDAYLSGVFTAFLDGGETGDALTPWLAALPRALRPWMTDHLKED